MKYITIQIPVIDTGHSAEAKVEKMHEELDELYNEFSTGPIDLQAAMGEMFDVLQVMHGFIQAGEEPAINVAVSELFSEANERHIEKIQRYAAERGWKVSE